MTDKKNRREFLKLSMMGGAGVALSAMGMPEEYAHHRANGSCECWRSGLFRPFQVRR